MPTPRRKYWLIKSLYATLAESLCLLAEETGHQIHVRTASAVNYPTVKYKLSAIVFTDAPLRQDKIEEIYGSQTVVSQLQAFFLDEIKSLMNNPAYVYAANVGSLNGNLIWNRAKSDMELSQMAERRYFKVNEKYQAAYPEKHNQYIESIKSTLPETPKAASIAGPGCDRVEALPKAPEPQHLHHTVRTHKTITKISDIQWIENATSTITVLPHTTTGQNQTL